MGEAFAVFSGGNAGDNDPTTFKFSSDNADIRLVKPDETPILPSEVPTLYGTSDGMTIFDQEIDVSSSAYSSIQNIPRPKKAIYKDLSDAAGWPAIPVEPDTVAIDPALGRFKFSEGDAPTNVSAFVALPADGEVILGWTNPLVSEWDGTTLVRKQGSFPANPSDGVEIYEGKNSTVVDTVVTNGTVYYYRAFPHNASFQYFPQIAIPSPQAQAMPQTGLNPNLPLNPDFEGGDLNNDGIGDGWGTINGSPGDGWAMSTSIKYSGNYAQEIFRLPGSVSTPGIGQDFTAQENTTYRFSAMVRTQGSGDVWVNVYTLEQNENGDSLFNYSTTVQSVGAFKEVSLTFKTPSYGGLPIPSWFQIRHRDDPGTSVYIDEVVLVAGNFSLGSPFGKIGSAWTGFGVPGVGAGVQVSGNYAYIPSGEGDFQAIDITNQAAPRVVGAFPVEFTRAVALRNNIAYLTKHSGLITVDVTDPTNPQWPNGVPQHINKGNIPWLAGHGGSNQVMIQGNIGYATVGGGGDPAFYTLDVTNPISIPELGSVSFGDSYGTENVFLNGTKACVGLGRRVENYETPISGGAAIVDISNPTTPTLLGKYLGEPGETVYDTPYLIGCGGNLLVMTSDWRDSFAPGGFRHGRLILVDISNPASPVRVGVYTFILGGNPDLELVRLYNAVMNGNYLYVTDGNYPCTQCSSGHWSYYRPTRLLTFNISNPNSPTLIHTYSSPNKERYFGLTQFGTSLYVFDFNYGVRIFSITNPAAPAPIGGTVTAAEGHYAWVNDDATFAYQTNTFGGTTHVVDISNPSAPVRRGWYWDGHWNEHAPLVGRGNYLYIPIAEKHINIVDVSNPDQPVKTGQFPVITPGGILYQPRIALLGNYAYVMSFHSALASGNARRSLSIYNISNPASPVALSTLPLPNTPLDSGNTPQLFVRGNYVYMMDAEERRFTVVNVSNPSSPFIVGSLTDTTNLVITRLTEMGGRLVVSESGYAYISTGEWGTGKLFYIVNASNPATPQYVGRVDTNQIPDPNVGAQVVEELRLAGRYLYLGDYGPLHIFDISNPAAPRFIFSSQQVNSDWVSGWGMGDLFGDFLYGPNLGEVNVTRILRDSEIPKGSVTVDFFNAPPLLASIGSKSVTEGQKLEFTISATDANMTMPALSASPLPSGATFTNNGDGTGKFTWTPNYVQSGTYTVRFEATDGNSTSFEDVTITVRNYRPPRRLSCPYIFVWDGEGFVKDNDILPAGNPHEYVDFYFLSKMPIPTQTEQGSFYSLQIVDEEDETSSLDHLLLFQVDHPKGVNIAPTPDGKILSYQNPKAPISAVDRNGNDVLKEIASEGEGDLYGEKGEVLIADFGKFEMSDQEVKMILRTDLKCPPVIDAQSLHLDVQTRGLFFGKRWREFAVVHPHQLWDRWAVPIPKDLLAKTDGTLKVRIRWTEPHKLDYLFLDTSEQAPITTTILPLIRAEHNQEGNVLEKLTSSDNAYAVTRQGDTIDLLFPAYTLPQDGIERNFILQSEGYYKANTPRK